MILGASYLEWAAMLTTAACIFLAGRNNVWTWPIGIVATCLYGILFFNIQLYADATLQLFFIGTGFVGWYGWLQLQRGVKLKRALQISAVKLSSLGMMIGVAVLVAMLYGTILKAYTDAFAPMIDSLVLTFSVLAQLLLMRRKIETWPMWLIVNTLAVPLFWSREIYLTAIMYGVFWIHAIYAWRVWSVKMKNGE